MALLPILEFPDPRLRTRAAPSNSGGPYLRKASNRSARRRRARSRSRSRGRAEKQPSGNPTRAFGGAARLYVGNLPYEMTTEQLADTFKVQKVRKTVNEYYMVAAGLPDPTVLAGEKERALALCAPSSSVPDAAACDKVEAQIRETRAKIIAEYGPEVATRAGGPRGGPGFDAFRRRLLDARRGETTGLGRRRAKLGRGRAKQKRSAQVLRPDVPYITVVQNDQGLQASPVSGLSGRHTVDERRFPMQF